MARTWSLRNLFTKAADKVPRPGTASGHVSGGEVVEFGDLRIDLAERTVTLRGRELRLNSEEFDVLVFLVGHPQRLITPHTRLATNCMGHGTRQSGFLPSLLSLTRKLDAAGGPYKHYLRTESWILYRFDPTSSSAAA